MVQPGPNSPRDAFGVDMERFVWHGMEPIQAGASALVGYAVYSLAGAYNDYNPTPNQVSFQALPVMIVNATADVSITGLVAGWPGEKKFIVNKGPANIYLRNLSGSSQAVNQMFLGADTIIPPGNCAELWYDPVNTQWQLASLRGGVLSSIPFFANGGGLGLPTGILGWVEIPAQCQIIGWKLLSTEQSTLSVDLWNSNFANWPLSNANSICAGNFPTLSNAKSNSDTALTGWTTSLAAGSILVLNLSSTNSQAIRLGFSLDLIRTQ